MVCSHAVSLSTSLDWSHLSACSSWSELALCPDDLHLWSTLLLPWTKVCLTLTLSLNHSLYFLLDWIDLSVLTFAWLPIDPVPYTLLSCLGTWQPTVILLFLCKRNKFQLCNPLLLSPPHSIDDRCKCHSVHVKIRGGGSIKQINRISWSWNWNSWNHVQALNNFEGIIASVCMEYLPHWLTEEQTIQ